MIDNYLTLLAESLEKKLNILNQMMAISSRQSEIMSSEGVAVDEFDACVDEKDALVRELTLLDDGFEQLYDRIKEELLTHKDLYGNQIKKLQVLIAELTEKSCTLQAQEARNKTLVEKYFARERDALKSGRKTSKAALDYYQSMNRSAVVPPQFMDKKK